MLVEWGDMHRVPRLWAYVGGAARRGALLGGREYFYPAGCDRCDDLGRCVDLTWLSFAAALGGAVLLGLASRRRRWAGASSTSPLPALASSC